MMMMWCSPSLVSACLLDFEGRSGLYRPCCLGLPPTGARSVGRWLLDLSRSWPHIPSLPPLFLRSRNHSHTGLPPPRQIMKLPLFALALAAVTPFSLADKALWFYGNKDCSGTPDQVGVVEIMLEAVIEDHLEDRRERGGVATRCMRGGTYARHRRSKRHLRSQIEFRSSHG
jgi:hypothetical protein